MDFDLLYPRTVQFFRAWFLDNKDPHVGAMQFASVNSHKVEALVEELQALHDATPIPLGSICLEVGLTLENEASCRSWLDDVIRGLSGLERSGAWVPRPVSDIDRGSRLDSCPALGGFLRVDLLETDEENAVRRFRERSSSEEVAQLVAEIRSVIDEDPLPTEEIEDEMGRYFAIHDDARVWLGSVIDCLNGQEVFWPETEPGPTRPDPVAIELEAAFPAAWRFFASYAEGQTDEQVDGQAVSSVLNSWSSGQVDSLRQELRELASQEDCRIDKLEDVSDLFFESRQDFRSWAEQIVRLLGG